jgi:carbamate kinase
MREEAERLVREYGWVIAADNDDYRRVVRSPLPKHIFEVRVIEFLVKMGVIVICAGGGGIPTIYSRDGSTVKALSKNLANSFDKQHIVSFS